MEILQGNFTQLPNTVIKGDKELTSKELTILTIILMTRNNKNICSFNIQFIYDILNIKDNNSRAKKEVKKILNILQDEEILQFNNNIFMLENEFIKDITLVDKNKNIFAYVLEDLIYNFTLILDNDIYNLIQYSYKNNIDTYSLIKTYIYICSCINTDSNSIEYLLAFPKILTIAEAVEVSEKTILKHLKILKDLNIFVFDYSGYKEDRNGKIKIKNDVMYYTRPENIELLLNRLQQKRSEEGFISINKRSKDKSNLKRKLKGEINSILNKQKNNKSTILEDEKLKLLQDEYNKLN